jgi:hypothetical protein
MAVPGSNILAWLTKGGGALKTIYGQPVCVCFYGYMGARTHIYIYIYIYKNAAYTNYLFILFFYSFFSNAEGAEKNCEKPQSGYLISGLRFM